MKKFIKRFNNLIKNIIFKLENKTNNKFQISTFNKFIITFICLLFFYLFYLSIPILYSKSWVQSNIESQLLKKFKINFSTSSNISYYILPSPHFLLKDVRIFKNDDEKKFSFADIKNLKVFIGQNNFFDKKKMTVKNIKIDNANFSLSKSDFKSLNNIKNNKFSNKQIEIKDSNIFFKNEIGETIVIIKIINAFSIFDTLNSLNSFNLRGEVFNVPFNFDFNKKFDTSQNEEIYITIKTLKLNVFNASENKKNIHRGGKNIISTLNSTIDTNYKIDDGIIILNSSNSKISNSKINYSGEASITPFNLNLNINLGDYKAFKISDLNFFLTNLIKTELFFNENISINISIITTPIMKPKIFHKSKINFNIINGKININKTKLINEEIGLLELKNSNFIFENNKLILNTDIMVDINNSDKLFSLFQTRKKYRKQIKNVFINLDYDLLDNQFEFNNIKIDNKKINDELLRVIEGFNDNNINNWNKNKRLFNSLFKIYEG